MAPDAEKLPLVTSRVVSGTTSKRRIATLLVGRLSIPTLFLFGFVYLQIAPLLRWSTSPSTKVVSNSLCPLARPLTPRKNDRLDENRAKVYSAPFRSTSAGVLAGFVQVQSPSYDDLGKVGGSHGDKRWDVFYNVTDYLQETFPRVFETLSLTKVNTHGIVLTWRGSDPALKPTLLTGHVDVVPIDPATLDKWTYPPFQGHYDGTFLWGRGSVDDKHAVSAIFEAVNLLVESEFVPERSLVLAFGFDEESKGRNGAGHIAKYLEEQYGPDGIGVIVDEGGLGLGDMFGMNAAIPATGEKGYVDVKFTLETRGGHSSIPPDHTSIGIISQLVNALEAHPFSPSLPLDSPVFSLLTCAVEHGQLPPALKSDIQRGAKPGKHGESARDHAANEVAKLGKGPRYLVSTSQAIDIIHAGVKVNALPESVELIANYRVAVGSTVQDVKDHITALARPISRRFGLSAKLFGSNESAVVAADEETGGGGYLNVVSINELAPAPVSPTRGSQAWRVLSGTIIHTLDHSDDLVVAPGIMTGNTDTRYYWNFSKNIYRFTPIHRSKSVNLHTVDEKLWFNDHIDAIWFFHELVRNYDEAVL